MLKVDVDRLELDGLLSIDEQVAPDVPLWDDTDVGLLGPLTVDLEARPAGEEVIVYGTLAGEVERSCRRCLQAVEVEVEASVSLVFRPGIGEFEAHREEVYPMAERARELDLSGPIREHVLLAVPEFVVCRDACEGLCPECGANLNEVSCDCEPSDVDDRWAPLRELESDEETD